MVQSKTKKSQLLTIKQIKYTKDNPQSIHTPTHYIKNKMVHNSLTTLVHLIFFIAI